MEQEQQEVLLQEQQSLNAPLEQSSQSLASSTPTPPTGGGTGVDPNEQGRHFKHLSDTSIQAQEAARWQAMANNSPRAQREGLIKDSATQKASSESPLNMPEDTGIPKNMQLSIEYMTKISLKEVRVHYDAQEAVEQGVATFHEGMDIYVAPGQKKQLGEEVWKVAEEIKQQSGGSGENQTDTSHDNLPTELNTPVEVEQPETSTPTGELNSDTNNTESLLESTGEEGQLSTGGGLSDLGNIEENPLPEGLEYKSEKPVPITPKPLPTTSTDQGFKAVKTAINTEGDKQQEHQSSEKEVEAAHKASLEPSNKKSSVAESQHMNVVEQKETPAFETSAFVEALMKKVSDIMPRDKEQADDFKKSGKVKQVKRAVSNSVASSKDQSVGPLDQANKQAPNLSGIESKQVAPLPPAAIGKNPADVQAQKAVPKPLDKDRVEQPLQNNATSLEEQMATNEMTEEQLSKSNEPTFQAALDSKKTAQQDSEDKTKQARQEEQQQRQQNKQEAENLGQEQMAAMHQDRASLMTGVHQKQQTASTSYTTEEQKVADKINSLFATTKTEVESKLSRLDSRVQQLFDKGAANAQRQFEAYVESRLNAYKEERYAGLSGKVSWLSDAFTGLPDEVNAFFQEGRNAYIRSMKRVIQNIARLVARELNAAKKRVQTGKQQVADYVNSLPDNLRKVGQQAAQDINSKFDELSSQVDAKQEELIDTLATKYTENLKKIDDRIEQLKAENKGLIDAAFEHLKGTWETIQKVKAMLTGALKAAGSAIQAILLDPIGFLGNLIDGIGQGFGNFLGGIQQHLTSGFIQWLTGAMSGIGIQMPEDVFSLQGIFSITTQALDLTWDFVRARAVKILGEKPVEAIEEGFEIFQVIKEKGIAGAWEHLKEQFTDLKATIMDSMMGMLITEVIEAGIKWVLGLLTPAGAFVKAAMMIVDVAKFFINQGSQLVELVNAFTASISAIAAGNVAQVAKGIEKALVISVPVLIGFLAAVANLGDVAAKVQKIFKKITGRIHGAVDGFIEKAGAWFKDKKGRRKAKRDAKKKEKEDKKKDKDNEQEDPKDKAKAEKGLRLGTAVVKNENLTKEQIEVELKKIERQEKLKDLDARLVEEAEQWHTFMLKSKAGSSKKEDRIRRKPTKATNEEEVSEADRQLHKRIAGQVKAKLEAIGKSTEGVETFEAFYELLKEEAVKLQREYQPQLRDGIKIAVDLVNQVQQDKKDGDVDVRVRIAPNTTSEAINIIYNKEIKSYKWSGLGIDERDFPQSHTIERHVGLSDSDLKRRIRDDNLVVASTFTNYGIANSTVMNIINSNISTIENWYNNSKRGLLPLKMNCKNTIGRYFTIEQMRVPFEATKATVILNRNDDVDRPFFVLTAFPYERNVEKKLMNQYG